MEKVTGIGGIFFKAREPGRLAAWYEENLGLAVKEGCADFGWREKDKPEQIGRTVWALFPLDTEHFGKSGSSLMINYRVSDLDRMLEQLRQHGVIIEKIEEYDYGRFAWLQDPEGNRIELWEPKGELGGDASAAKPATQGPV